MAKRFLFAVIDDESGEQGYERFLSVLHAKNYLISQIPSLSLEEESLGFNTDENQPIDFHIYTSYYGEGYEESFCEALARFKKEHKKYDFYCFD